MYHPLLEKEVHTPPEVARVLGLSPATIHEWIKTGKIEGYKIGERFFVLDDELTRMKKEMTTPFVIKNED